MYHHVKSGALKAPLMLNRKQVENGKIRLTKKPAKAHNVAMAGQRPSVYTNTNTEAPGATVYYLRDKVLDISQREFSALCMPPIDHSTLQRVEKGVNWKKDTLENIASTLSRLMGKRITAVELFIPPEIADYLRLDESAKAVIKQSIKWASSDATKTDTVVNFNK